MKDTTRKKFAVLTAAFMFVTHGMQQKQGSYETVPTLENGKVLNLLPPADAIMPTRVEIKSPERKGETPTP